ncbi:mCG146064, partial [Mus musculus]
TVSWSRWWKACIQYLEWWEQEEIGLAELREDSMCVCLRVHRGHVCAQDCSMGLPVHRDTHSAPFHTGTLSGPDPRSRGTYRSFSKTRQNFLSIHLSKLPAAPLRSRYNKNKILSTTSNRETGGGQ